MNFFNVYRSFIDKHNVTGLSHQECLSRHIEGHHLIPKSNGGKRLNNIVFLSEFDHCIAHLLYNVAAFQCCRPSIRSYVPRGCVTSCGDKDILAYWNPISKIKVKVISVEDNKTEVMTIANAAKLILDQWKQSWENLKARNAAVVQVIVKCYSKNHEFAKKNFQFDFVSDPNEQRYMHNLKLKLNARKQALQAKMDEISKELSLIEAFNKPK